MTHLLRLVLLCVLWLVAGSVPMASASDDSGYDDVLFCNSCYSGDQFRLFGEGAVGQGQAGFYKLLVANPATNILYDVFVNVEPDMGYTIVSSHALSSPQPMVDLFLEVAEVFGQKEYVVPAQIEPVPDGLSSFSGYTQEQVGILISSQAWYATLSRAPTLTRVFRWLRGYTPVAVVIFSNGDVAKFKVVPVLGYSACCTYEPGTARDREGNFIGDGSSDGSEYVQEGDYGPEFGTPTDSHWAVRILTDGGGYRFVCGRVNGGTPDCYWLPF